MKHTKYEKARIIGARALQLSMGAPFMLQLNNEDLSRMRYSCLEIAKLEFEKRVIPITVKRPMPETTEEAFNQPIPLENVNESQSNEI